MFRECEARASAIRVLNSGGRIRVMSEAKTGAGVYPSKRKALRYSDAGFTLLEFLIYTAVFTIVLLSVLAILNITTNVRARQEAKSEVLRNASFVIERISRLGKDADAFGNCPNISSTICAATSTQLDFIINSATTTILVDTGVGTFTIDSGAGPEDLLSLLVLTTTSTDPIFQKIGNTVQINLNLRYNDEGNNLYKYSTKAETTITLR